MADKFASRTGDLATIGAVGAGFVISYFSAPSSNIGLLAVLCVALCIFGILGYDLLQKIQPSHLASFIYLAIACTLVIALMWLNLNMSIAIFPLVSQTLSAKNWRWLIAVSIILLSGFAAISFSHNTTIREILTYLASITSGIIFVGAFTAMTKRAHEDRNKVEQLAVELRQANLKLSEYATQVEELATTRERNRLAREIHDSLGHYLTVVNVQLEAAQTLLTNNPSRANEALKKAQSLTKEGLGEVRRSVAALRASPTENQSLREAIQQIIRESATSDIQMSFEVSGAERKLQPATELTLYRAAQEGLTNIRKHAHATQASVQLQFAKTQVTITVADNGKNTQSPDNKDVGFGLLGLRERAQLLGGTCETYQSDTGFELVVSVPTQEAA